MLLCKKWKTKALIRLRICAGWSAPAFFANPQTGFLAFRPILSVMAPFLAWMVGFKLNLEHTSTGLDKQKKISVKLSIFSYPSILTYVLGAQINRLIEAVLLSTHYICFGWEIRKLNFRYALLTKVLYIAKYIVDSNPIWDLDTWIVYAKFNWYSLFSSEMNGCEGEGMWILKALFAAKFLLILLIMYRT